VVDRYDASGTVEGQYEPGSNKKVLKNKLGITSTEEMDKAEAQALLAAMQRLLQDFEADQQFTAKDICHMHEEWLGSIYEWAGQYRQVQLSKGEFPFAAANRVPSLMEQYEKEQLAKFTPCDGMSHETLAKAMAECHVEFELIHPFREGNGRVGRIVTTLMALQAGLPPLNYDLLVDERKEDYYAAIQTGLDKNYVPMEELFLEIIKHSLTSS